jgi:hypothetical protein
MAMGAKPLRRFGGPGRVRTDDLFHAMEKNCTPVYVCVGQLEVFLYDWWPIRNEARLSDRLADMPVRIRYANAAGPEAWKADWPAVSPRGEQTTEAKQETLNRAS